MLERNRTPLSTLSPAALCLGGSFRVALGLSLSVCAGAHLLGVGTPLCGPVSCHLPKRSDNLSVYSSLRKGKISRCSVWGHWPGLR